MLLLLGPRVDVVRSLFGMGVECFGDYVPGIGVGHQNLPFTKTGVGREVGLPPRDYRLGLAGRALLG